jgi:hypothetical protein
MRLSELVQPAGKIAGRPGLHVYPVFSGMGTTWYLKSYLLGGAFYKFFSIILWSKKMEILIKPIKHPGSYSFLWSKKEKYATTK